MDTDEELGFIGPLIAALAPAVAPVAGELLSGLTGGGGGGAAGGVMSALAPALSAMGLSPGTPAAGVSSEDLRGVVRELISTVPPPVREQVQTVIREMQAQRGNLEDAGREITQRIDSRFHPAIQGALGALRLGQTQREATHEHQSIVQDSRRWESSEQRQARILSKLDAIERRLGGRTAVIRGQAVDVLGGAAALGASNGNGG
jgi:uncharacterized membrane protein